jgi:hypothetical protein
MLAVVSAVGWAKEWVGATEEAMEAAKAWDLELWLGHKSALAKGAVMAMV